VKIEKSIRHAPDSFDATDLPLAGIRVIDATSNISGPYGGAILADLGAEVIKIENPNGDPSRLMVPLDGDRSAYFHIVNRNKDVMNLDLKSVAGKAKLDELFSSSDIFLTNFLPKQLERLDLAPDKVMSRFPHLIYGNLTSYGSSGNDANRPGYDATIQARTGIMFITGEQHGNPVRTGVSVLDIGAGTWLATGILAALVKRNRTGKGSLIETSLYETGIAWVSYHLSSYQLSHLPSGRFGASHPTFSPYGLLATADGTICLGVGSDEIFRKLCNEIERPELATDPRFQFNEGRAENRDILMNQLEESFRKQPSNYWIARLSEGGVPIDEVLPPEAIFDDTQEKAIEMLLPNPDNSTSVQKIPGLPLRIDGRRPQIRKSAPHRDKSN
jgi:crotonobetainyl-CoA:carnitine CoA-transferase CaiB-like acyl-CoA transferase